MDIIPPNPTVYSGEANFTKKNLSEVWRTLLLHSLTVICISGIPLGTSQEPDHGMLTEYLYSTKHSCVKEFDLIGGWDKDKGEVTTKQTFRKKEEIVTDNPSHN